MLALELVVPVVSEFVDDEPPRDDPELEPDTAFPGREAFEDAAAIGVDTLLDRAPVEMGTAMVIGACFGSMEPSADCE